VTRLGKLIASGGVFGVIVGVAVGTWYALTRDVHTLKDTPPDSLPPAPALGKTGWKLVDKLLPKLQAMSSSTGIPLGLLVGWIAKESGGRLNDKTSLDERGYFQLMPDESRAIGVEHERLSTDSDYSLDAGMKLIRKYQSTINNLDLAGAPAGSTYYWRLVKLAHSMGSGQTKKIVDRAKAAGQAGSWNQLEQFALGLSINGPQPKKWFPFIDLIYRIGAPFGFGNEVSSPPALIGVACGFDFLGVDD
jgi:hypothetical protein